MNKKERTSAKARTHGSWIRHGYTYGLRPVGRWLTGFVDLSQRPHEHATDHVGARGDCGARVRRAVEPAARLAQAAALDDPARLASSHDAAGGDAGAEAPRVPARGHDGAGGGAL